MNESAKMIKTAIMMELAKEGKSLQDLENHLLKTGMEKTGAKFVSEMIPGMIKNLFNLYGGSALAVGGLGGLGAYVVYNANGDSTQQQLKKEREKQQYDQAAAAIQDKVKYPTIL